MFTNIKTNHQPLITADTCPNKMGLRSAYRYIFAGESRNGSSSFEKKNYEETCPTIPGVISSMAGRYLENPLGLATLFGGKLIPAYGELCCKPWD